MEAVLIYSLLGLSVLLVSWVWGRILMWFIFAIDKVTHFYKPYGDCSGFISNRSTKSISWFIVILVCIVIVVTYNLTEYYLCRKG